MCRISNRHSVATVLTMMFAAFAACNTGDMHEQPRYEPLEASDFFEDGRASRPLVEGTVARGQLRIDDHFYLGKVDGELVPDFPNPVDQQMLARGREQYNIFCTACHDRVGTGNGMAVQRGFPRPPSFHTQRLREQPVGHFYDVITNGYGRMMDYREQVKPADRWAIVAYIRALQLSQYAPRDVLNPADFEALQNEKTSGRPTEG